MLHMLHWLYTYVASVCLKCFIYFKRMLQVFYLDVAYVSTHTHMLQAYVVNVSSVSDVCCSKLNLEVDSHHPKYKWFETTVDSIG
jgi:hypothetical protein